MNNQDRIELGLIKNREERLRQDMEALSGRIRRLEERQLREESAAAPVAEAPIAVPPIIFHPQSEPAQAMPQEAPATSMVEPVLAMSGMGSTTPEELTPPQPAPEFQASRPSPVAAKPESFEMRLGTYWFVRVGIVLLLTALAFLGNYAYQNFIFKMPPAGKVAMLYVISGLVLGVGAWLQRKRGKESLRNFAQVLFAGGLAAVYFTTYAAHHIERLRVIQNPVLDGALLLAWAGFIVFLADRKKSELMAVFALGLAFYTSTITRSGTFTLYSNLVLTVASVLFLCRNGWAFVSGITLPATYAGYAFWRFYAPSGWRFPSPEEGLLFSAAFLCAYWIVFTSAVFLSKHPQFKDGRRAVFLSFNNGAALSLFLLTMFQLQTGGLWKVCLGFGSALLILAYLSRKLLSDEPIVESSYLTQGLALVTAGFIAKSSGMNLALLLTVESVVVFALGCRLPSAILRGAGVVSGFLAVAWAFDGLDEMVKSSAYMGLGVAIGMLVNTMFASRRTPEREPVRPDVAGFATLVLAAIAAVIWIHVERASLGSAFAATGALLTFSIYLLRIRELTVLSQVLVFFGQLAWLANAVARSGPWEPWTEPAIVVAISLALLHWWQRQKTLEIHQAARYGLQAAYALAVVGLLFVWLMSHLQSASQHHVAAFTALLLLLTLYSTVTRSGILAFASQLLFLPAIAFFLEAMTTAHAPWQSVLVLPFAFFVLAAGTVGWLRNRPALPANTALALRNAAKVYGWIGLALLAVHVAKYVPARNCPWVFAAIGLFPFLWAGLRNGELLPYSMALVICATVSYAAPMRDGVWTHLPNIFFIAILVFQQRVARRLNARYNMPEPVHVALMIIASLCLWLFLSRYVQQNVTGFLLTVVWSALALVLFALGMALRERPYRWLGLAVLGCSLGRVILFDVWKLHTIYRILSFMALGIVLLLLGYFYNRYQEKIRGWL